jgi:peptide/nickel transport system permease protein
MSSARLLGKLLAATVALLGASLIAFALGVIAPGDPAVAALSQGGEVIPSAEAIAALRAEWGLDQPLHVQYLSWLGRVLQGDLGTSYFSGEPVLVELGRRLVHVPEITRHITSPADARDTSIETASPSSG